MQFWLDSRGPLFQMLPVNRPCDLSAAETPATSASQSGCQLGILWQALCFPALLPLLKGFWGVSLSSSSAASFAHLRRSPSALPPCLQLQWAADVHSVRAPYASEGFAAGRYSGMVSSCLTLREDPASLGAYHTALPPRSQLWGASCATCEGPRGRVQTRSVTEALGMQIHGIGPRGY